MCYMSSVHQTKNVCYTDSPLTMTGLSLMVAACCVPGVFSPVMDEEPVVAERGNVVRQIHLQVSFNSLSLSYIL